MEALQKALDAQTKDIDKAKTDADFKALEEKHEKLISKASEDVDAEIQSEIDAITKATEDEIEKNRAEEEKNREKINGIVYTTDHTIKEMKAEAKSRGIKGYSRMTETELISILNA